MLILLGIAYLFRHRIEHAYLTYKTKEHNSGRYERVIRDRAFAAVTATDAQHLVPLLDRELFDIYSTHLDTAFINGWTERMAKVKIPDSSIIRDSAIVTYAPHDFFHLDYPGGLHVVVHRSFIEYRIWDIYRDEPHRRPYN